MMLSNYFKVTLVIAIFSSAFGTIAAVSERSDSIALVEVIQRLSAVIAHYKNNEQGLNVDGLYGLRIAQG